MPQSVADFGTLHRASVRRTEQLGPTQAVFVECPDVAPGYEMGPLSSLVPDLAEGERVLLACIGNNISDMVILQRWTPRWPTVAEVPELAGRLGELATDADLDLLTERVNRNTGDLADTRTELYELDRSLGYARSKIEELPESFQRAQANVDTVAASAAANASAIAALRTERYGSADRTWRPRVEMRMTADINGLAASTDYLLVGSFSAFRDTEAANGKSPMLIIGTSATDPSRVVIPVDGEYDIEYAARTSATSGLLAIGVILNGTTANSVSSRVTTQSIFRFLVGGTGEGSVAFLNRKAQLSAGDVLTFSIWQNVAFNLTAAYFGSVRTNVKVTRVGA
jgi:hypothetical protein